MPEVQCTGHSLRRRANSSFGTPSAQTSRSVTSTSSRSLPPTAAIMTSKLAVGMPVDVTGPNGARGWNIAHSSAGVGLAWVASAQASAGSTGVGAGRPAPHTGRAVSASERVLKRSARPDTSLDTALDRHVTFQNTFSEPAEAFAPLTGDATTHALDAAQLLNVLVLGRWGHAAGVVGRAEQFGLQTPAHQLAGEEIHALGARAGTRADHASQIRAAEQQADAVVHGPASRQDAVADGREPYWQ